MLYLFFLIGLQLTTVAATPARNPEIEVTLGTETKLVEGGTFPYMFRSREGTLVLQVSMPGAGDPTLKTSGVNGPPRNLRSEDRGKTWHEWKPAKNQGIGPGFEGSAVQVRDGAILIFNYIPESRGNGHFVVKRWRSTDQWKTLTGPEDSHFTLPQAMDTMLGDTGEPMAAILFHRSVIELPNGDLLASVYGRFKGDDAASEYLPQMKKFRSLLLRSKDQGRNWTYVSTIAVDPKVGQEGFDEPVLLRLSQGKHKGRLICLMRTGRKDPLYQVHSDDEGTTWTGLRALNLLGVDPDLIEMSNGVLVCSFGHKPQHSTQGGLKDDGNFLAFSLDQGQTWTNVTRLSSVPTCAYTTVREIAPGELYVVYDERDRKDYRSPNRRVFGRNVGVKLK